MAVTAAAALILCGVGTSPAAASEHAAVFASYSGHVEKWTVPAGVTVLSVDIAGAQGGASNAAGGLAAELTGDIRVTPGATLYIFVGGKGGDGRQYYSGGGGGGGSFIYTSPTQAGLLAAAGGGGGSSSNGGAGDASTTTSGTDGQQNGGAGGADGLGGTATDYAAAGGGLLTDGADITGTPEKVSQGGKSLINGGAGGPGYSNSPNVHNDGGYGGGGGGGGSWAGHGYGGGGGGGYSGGGGGGFSGNTAGGGGGGGSYLAGTIASQSANHTGDGFVVLRYVVPVATNTTLAVSPPEVKAGQETILTATITPASGTEKPTGTMTFLDGSTVLGTATVDPGTATLSVRLPGGTHRLTAVYAGDIGFAPSTSDVVNHVVTTVESASQSTENLPATGVAIPLWLPASSAGLLALGVIMLVATRRRRV